MMDLKLEPRVELIYSTLPYSLVLVLVLAILLYPIITTTACNGILRCTGASVELDCVVQ
jgi:hypothetical protein